MISPEKALTAKKFLQIIGEADYFSPAETDRIAQALRFGQAAHKGQKRVSGVDYFTGHCTHVGLHLHRLNMSPAVIVAGLLHDTLEDTETAYEDLEKNFGREVADLVDGVSNLGAVKYRHYRRHIASLRRFFVAIAKDVRVILIKLCDRHHNLQTLQYLPEEKQKRIAEESMLVHAQLAQRLYMAQLYQAINDLAFAYVFPEDCQRVQKLQKKTLAKANKTIESIYRQCLATLSKDLGYTPTVDRRIKSTYSLYKKLLANDWNIEAVYDIIALRIIVNTPAECYRVLGLIHARWRPLQNRFKDYIAAPKTNGYQSLHTTIFTGDGQVIEIQIKTQAMHQMAEYGTALHLSYKQQTAKDPLQPQKVTFHWLDQLKELVDSENFDIRHYLQELRTDFFTDRVFVKTPQGDVIDLIEGATVLDFAFAVHTDIGLKAKGGQVNGVYKALKTPLRQQDIVEIIVDKKVKPQNKWLTWVKTPLARQSLRRYLKQTDQAKKGA